MNIELDDTWFVIKNKDTGYEIFKTDWDLKFDKVVKAALTNSQYIEYIGRDTARTFKISKKKELEMLSAIKKATL